METIKKVVFYKLAWFKGSVGFQKAVLATYIAGVAANNWTSMTVDARILIIISMYLSGLNYLDGYLDQTASRLAKGKLPIGDDDSGNTKHYTKDETTKTPTNP